MDVDDTDNLSLFLDVEGMTSLGVGFRGVAYTYPCLLLASMLAIQSRPTSKTNRRKNIFKVDGSHCLNRWAQQRELVTQVGVLIWVSSTTIYVDEMIKATLIPTTTFFFILSKLIGFFLFWIGFFFFLGNRLMVNIF